MELALLRPVQPFCRYQVRSNIPKVMIIMILIIFTYQQCHQDHLLSHPTQNINGDVIFIRHAQSQFNQQTSDYVQRKQIPFNWKQLSKDPEYLSLHKYSLHLHDAPITEKGYRECAPAKHILNNFTPDLILVSPLNRTLQTCNFIFPQPPCPVIVQPLLSQSLISSCDFSSEIQYKKKRYPSYNFQKVENQGNFYFINNQSDENRRLFQQIIEQNKQSSHQAILKEMLKMMVSAQIQETPLNLRIRTSKIKELLKQYRTQYKNIVVVAHYNIIRYTLSKSFNEHNEPLNCQIKNCQIRSSYVSEL